ncbi:helix-turn-helix domain-containing protein [Lichenicola sp.]|uniref:helix-turn-helix domain-containing protein n=1 Tax=Lichenicola sp. TaxID=2804529 RepID=UPI003B00028F
MSTTEQPEQVRTVTADTSMLPVGAALRVKREQLGWTLPDVAAWLRIKLSYLEALESGQVAKLPGNTYALGFLRAYAGALGLDADDISRRFRHETKDINRKPELAFPAPVPERGVPAGAVVLLGVLLVGGAYVAWYEFTGHERLLSHPVPAVPAALVPYAGGRVPATSPQVATVMPAPGQVPSALPPPPAAVLPETAAGPAASAAAPAAPAASAASVGAGAAPTAASTAASSTATAPPASGPGIPATAAAVGPAAASAGPAAAASNAPSATAASGPVAAPGQITLKASATCWVQVRQVGGKVIYDHVLGAGDSWVVPADSAALTLTTGNAGGLTLTADGVTSPVLGRNGAVRRNIPLDAASIRNGSIAAPPAAGDPGSTTSGPGSHPRQSEPTPPAD